MPITRIADMIEVQSQLSPSETVAGSKERLKNAATKLREVSGELEDLYSDLALAKNAVEPVSDNGAHLIDGIMTGIADIYKLLNDNAYLMDENMKGFIDHTSDVVDGLNID